MSFAGQLTQTVTLVAPGSKTDVYNNTVPDWQNTTQVDEPGLIQQASGSTEDQVDRDTVVTDYVLFLLPTSVITSAHRAIEGGRTFEVIGQPDLLRRRQGPHHIEAHLRRVVG
jgi:head-tail adaptor